MTQIKKISFSELLLLANLDDEKIHNEQELITKIAYLSEEDFSFYRALLYIKYNFVNINQKRDKEKLTFDDLVALYLGKDPSASFLKERYYQNNDSYEKIFYKYAKYHVLNGYWDLCKLLNNLYLYHEAYINKQECYMEQGQLMTIKRLLKKER